MSGVRTNADSIRKVGSRFQLVCSKLVDDGVINLGLEIWLEPLIWGTSDTIEADKIKHTV